MLLGSAGQPTSPANLCSGWQPGMRGLYSFDQAAFQLSWHTGCVSGLNPNGWLRARVRAHTWVAIEVLDPYHDGQGQPWSIPEDGVFHAWNGNVLAMDPLP